jgi:hypothetical protein
VLDDHWCERVGNGIVVLCRWGDEELGFIAHDDCGIAVGQEIHNSVLYCGVWEGVAGDISPSGVPLEKLYVGDKDALSAPAGEDLVCVDEGSALGAVFVADVESDVVLDVELPCAFVILEREA